MLINGSACAACVVPGGRAVQLRWGAAMEGAPTAVLVQMASGGGGGGGGGGDGTLDRAALDGAAAEAQWEADEAARQSYEPARLSAGGACAPNATLLAWAANASGFARRMGAAGLGGRFEAAQAGAVLRALNVSAARCEGRRDGSIAPMPEEPTSWHKYGVKYNQTEVEDYFDDLVGRIWRGLATTVGSYERGNASQRRVLQLFRGGEVQREEVESEVEAARLDWRIAEAERVLGRLRRERREL